MIDFLFSSPFSFLLWITALLTAIAVHEFSHALAADHLGDPTPRLNGRLTLNPLAHLDPLGTLMLILFRFGWGKPVPIDPFNLQNPRRDAAVISLAGPASNLLLAAFLSLIIRLAHLLTGSFGFIAEMVLTPFIILNVALAVFNLIPIHPLDGGKILVGLLPQKQAYPVDEFLNQYGLILIILLVFPIFNFSLISMLVAPMVNLILTLLLPGAPLI